MSTPSPQLPLALRYPPDQRLETFVSEDVALLPQLRDFALAGTRRGLYVEGASGTGKTHLAIGLCAEADRLGRRAVYLPLRHVIGRVHEATQGLESHDLVAVDDVDAIAGDRGDEIALFDLHNRLHDAGRSVFYTASAAPEALPDGLADLRSRLGQCVRVALQPLDDAARHDLLRLRAERRGLQVDAAPG